MSDTNKWFVAHTYSGYENKVASNIEKMVESRGMQDQILEVKIPTRIGEAEKNDHIVEVEEKCYPCYVFIKAAVDYKKVANSDEEELAMSDDAWFVIRNTRGVTGFVGPESKATPLSDKEVELYGLEENNEIMEELPKSKPIPILEIGEEVEITEDSLEGMIGVISSIDTINKRVKVDINWFGKNTPTDLSIYDVKKIEKD